MTQIMKKEKPEGSVRLNKYISDAGICSRREADRLIEAGKVCVDGVPAKNGFQVLPGQQVTVNGKEIQGEEELILLAMNKPRGVVCTTDKRWDDRTVYEVLNYPKRVFSVGRLDKDSEGLLLMTNNGDILNKIMRAGNYHEKEYLVTVDREITKEFLKKMAEGVYLRELDVKTRPCKMELAGPKRFRIVLTQGLNRQIRRMCAAFHYNVTRLVRVRVMNIELGDLKPGEYRSISRKEYAALTESLKNSRNPGSSSGEQSPERQSKPGSESERKNLETKRISDSKSEKQKLETKRRYGSRSEGQGSETKRRYNSRLDEKNGRTAESGKSQGKSGSRSEGNRSNSRSAGRQMKERKPAGKAGMYW